MKKEFNIFDDQCQNVSEGFETLAAAIAYIKSEYTRREWFDAELTLNEVLVDNNGCVLEFTDQINPFND
jgi:hypothetical protein